MSEPDKTVYRIFIEAPVAAVWKELTRLGEPLPCFFGSVMHVTAMRPGGALQMRTKNGRFVGIVGEILEVQPPHKLKHTFSFTDNDDPPCVVTYELRELDGGTEFILTNEQVPAGTKTEKNMRRGGEFIARVLRDVVETGSPQSLKDRLFLWFCAVTEGTWPKRCASENWPLQASTEETAHKRSLRGAH